MPVIVYDVCRMTKHGEYPVKYLHLGICCDYFFFNGIIKHTPVSFSSRSKWGKLFSVEL